MSFTTTTLRDTVVNVEGVNGTVTILVNIDNDTTSTNVITDVSALDGHANRELNYILVEFGGV